MSEFDPIRPYNDDEVRPCIERLLADNEFIDSIAYLKLPSALRFSTPFLRSIIRSRVAHELADVNRVSDFQGLIEHYLRRVLDRTVKGLTVSGLEHLDTDRAHLFISNHRDIAMDPALVNWALYSNGFSTLRIAIGDNLLSKPFASDLMRLNKSFVVNRSATSPREKLKTAKVLSKYIHASVLKDNENVWIAQREGRAKDGIDVTNPAIISMLMLSKPKTQSLSDFVREANIVPVSVSYEYDPCDYAKANELYEKQQHGHYQKQEHEDVASIATGITGYKGDVHLAFGAPLVDDYQSNDDVVTALDKNIKTNYVLQLTNCFAYQDIEGKQPEVNVGAEGQRFDSQPWRQEREQFAKRLAACKEAHRDLFLRSYANPVYVHLQAKSG